MATRAVEMTIQFVAWDTANNVGKTGDNANFAMRWIKDGTASALTNAVSEVDATNTPGIYKVTLTSTETDANIGTLAGKSSTASIVIIPVTIQFERLPDAVPGAAGGLFIAGSNAATTVNITGNITGTIATVTNLTNLPSIPANWLTAAGIAANALNGKGDWLTSLGATAPAGWIDAAAVTGNPSVTLGNVAHGGAAATLTLLSGIISNTAGAGLSIIGTTAGIAVAATGSSSRAMSISNSAAAGKGIEILTVGHAIDATSSAGSGIKATGVNTSSSFEGHLSGDVRGRILGGGASTITGTGVRAVDASGNNIAPAATALSTVQWTNNRAGFLDKLNIGDEAIAHTGNAASFQADVSGLAVPGSAMTLTSDERDAIATALLDLVDGIAAGRTPRQAIRALLAAAVGKLSGADGNTITIRDVNDVKNMIVATVDEHGNRSAISLDLT